MKKKRHEGIKNTKLKRERSSDSRKCLMEGSKEEHEIKERRKTREGRIKQKEEIVNREDTTE